MDKLLFGTAGIPLSTPHRSTAEGIARVKDIGLDCMEIEFVEGFYLKEEEAREVGYLASGLGVSLSVHAPYYLNFNAHEIRKMKASQGMLRKGVRLAFLCQASSVVFHPGFYLGDGMEETCSIMKKNINDVVSSLEDSVKEHVMLRPEVSGKKSQFGSLEEILYLCQGNPYLAPCIDFAHLHARTGGLNSYDEFVSVLESIKNVLGPEVLNNMHIHVSGIRYGKGGEIAHLALDESDLKYKELLKALKDFNIKGMVISESPTNEEDALILKDSFECL